MYYIFVNKIHPTTFLSNLVLVFWIYFFVTRTTVSHKLFLYLHLKATLFIIRRSFWHWMMQKTFLFPGISVLHMYRTHIPPICIQRYRQLVDMGQPLDSNNTSYMSRAVQHRDLVPHYFDSFWTSLHKYVPHRSVRWRSVALHTQAQNFWAASVCCDSIVEWWQFSCDRGCNRAILQLLCNLCNYCYCVFEVNCN